MTDSTDAQLGSVTISPDTGEVGTWGTWVAAFTVGTGGIATGGGIQMSLPVRWHQWIRNSARKMQTTDPTDAFYVSARTSRSDVTLRCELADATEVEFPKMNRMNLGGWRPMSRFGWTVCVTVLEGSLEAGDTIDVVYGDTSQGGRGFTPPLYAGSPELVHAAVDSTGDGEHLMLPDESLPLLSHTPGSPVELLIVLPTKGVVGEPAKLRMVALDEFHNPVALPDTPVHLVVEEGSADIEQSPANLGDAGTLGSRTLTVTPTGAGVLRVRGTSVDGRLYTKSNPCVVSADAPAKRLYWGDIHSHTHYSSDGTGTGDDHFRYARYGSLLDLYCATDHNNTNSLTHAGWRHNLEYTERWHQPGVFVTLFGFEMGFGQGIGHRNVYYKNAEGAYWEAGEITLQQIWDQSVSGEVVTIPHHTGGMGHPGGGVYHDWSIDDPRFQTTIEIYSSHGHSEEYAPNHPLSMDIADFTLQGPQDLGNYAQDAWLAGLKMGVIASSDNHMAQPGKEGFGVIAVWASEFTREAVFEAIRQRRTYGTTGSRIYLEFSVNGHPLGSEIELAAGQSADIHVEVLGTGPLRWIEILRADLDRPEDRFSIVHREWFPGDATQMGFSLDWSDVDPPANGMYYVRTRQRDFVHGRVAEAWSSPVWVSRGSE